MKIAVRIRTHTQKTKLHTFTVEYSSLLIHADRLKSYVTFLSVAFVIEHDIAE